MTCTELKRNWFATFDDAMYAIVRRVMRFPDFDCSPRGQRVKEVLATSFTLENPRARLLASPARKVDYGFATGEFFWYLTGKEDLETMLYYNKRMSQFSDDGKTLNSAYGWRIGMSSFSVAAHLATYGGSSRLSHRAAIGFLDHGSISQWTTCIDTLVDDQDSRRAVMTINRPEDELRALVSGSKDVPCTLALQFFVRDGKLDLHATMRSNDAIWGLAYDLFSFTLFQECMLRELQKHKKFSDLQLGAYHHTAGSLHIYERHFEMAEKMIAEADGFPESGGHYVPAVAQMEPLPDLIQLSAFSEGEELLRTKKIAKIEPSRYEGCLKWMAERLNEHRKKRDSEELEK